MHGDRYSESQILCGLREVWASLGSDNRGLRPEMRIDTAMKADGWFDEVDLAEVFYKLEQFFGFTCTQEEWSDWFGLAIANQDMAEWDRVVAPRLTFGALTQFIAARTTVVASFDPISVFGRPCASAGAFTGLQQLAAAVTHDPTPFAPSARITDTLRGSDLDGFWTRLRWMTEGVLPGLPKFWPAVACLTTCLGVVALIVGVGTALAACDALVLGPALAVVGICWATVWACNRFTRRLPTGIETFRDLSLRIAHHRS